MKKYCSKENLLYFFSSYIFALTLMFTSMITKNDGVNTFIKDFHFTWGFFIKTLIISFPCFIILKMILHLLNKVKIQGYDKMWKSRNVYLITFIGVFITSLIFLLAYYPGANMVDTLNIIHGPIYTSTQHPLFYNLWMHFSYRLFFKLFGSMNLAFFAMGVSQIIVLDLVITYMIGWFYKTFKNKLSTALLMFYFMFIPIVSNYNSVLIKDSFFAIILLLHIPLIYELIKSNGAWLSKKYSVLKTIILFSATVLIRNNGVYVILFMIVIFYFVFKKYLKQLTIILITVLLISKIPNLVFLKYDLKPLFQEKIGVPIQQISYVFANNGNISNKDKKYLNKIMPLELIKNSYNPFSVDAIKWHPEFNREYLNETKTNFMKTWFHLLPSNFEAYVKSYLLLSYHLWAEDSFIPDQSSFFGLDLTNKEAVSYYKGLHPEDVLPQKILKPLRNYYEHTTKYISNGWCFWALIILILLCVDNKKYEFILFTLPLLGVWLTLMISAPISYALRYMCPFVYLLPFIYLIILKEKKD